jgi:hypothetical protein
MKFIVVIIVVIIIDQRKRLLKYDKKSTLKFYLVVIPTCCRGWLMRFTLSALARASKGGDRVEEDDAGVVGDAEPIVDSVVLLTNRTMGGGSTGFFNSWLATREDKRTRGAFGFERLLVRELLANVDGRFRF